VQNRTGFCSTLAFFRLDQILSFGAIHNYWGGMEKGGKDEISGHQFARKVLVSNENAWENVESRSRSVLSLFNDHKWDQAVYTYPMTMLAI
jgi:hypothetical protein